jgi:hypothetical protein
MSESIFGREGFFISRRPKKKYHPSLLGALGQENSGGIGYFKNFLISQWLARPEF